MSKVYALICPLLLGSLAGCAPVPPAQSSAAQGLVISNARIIDGKGGVIERGAVVVRDGRIVSVSADAANIPGALQVDAPGMTAMPGFIDGHRHLVGGDPAQWLADQAAPRMQEFLDAGFTTVLDAGGPLEQLLELRRRLERGEIKGPRLIVSGRVPLARSPAGARGGPSVDPARAPSSWAPRTQAAMPIPAEETRAAVRRLAEAGVDAVKTAIVVTPGGPEKETLSLIAAELKPLGIATITHAVTVEDTIAAVEAGVTTLVHTPVHGEMSEAQARRIAESGIPMMSTLGVFVPFFDDNNEPIFRDRTPFPWERLYHAGEGPVNARLLWNAGIVYGFGTDTGFHPRETLLHELRALNLAFSPKDIVTIMTRHSAAAVGRSDQIGTLEPGKLADIVLIDGDPLTNSYDLLNVKMVIKGGEILADRR